MNNRLWNIDLLKFIAIIMMVIDHIMISTVGQLSNPWQLLYFSFVPLCQMAFLLSSGYLLARLWQPGRWRWYAWRAAELALLFIGMSWAVGESLLGSQSILMSFALSIVIVMPFLQWHKIPWLWWVIALFIGLDILMWQQGGHGWGQAWLSDYSYPVNSYGLYFILGALLAHYQDRWRAWWHKKSVGLLALALLCFYPLFFFSGIIINKYNLYWHLPWLVAVSTYLGWYAIYHWPTTTPRGWGWISRVADALLWIYVVHYIVLFGWATKHDWQWWQASLAVLFIIIVLSYTKKAWLQWRQARKHILAAS
ncbi:MAG: acyltransferase family protein [Candidatus Komeilibacteria bacterium]